MTKILTWLTYVLVGSVVVVLAYHLIAIAAALLRANRNLKRLVYYLEETRDNAAPLKQDLSTVNNAAVALRDQLSAVDQLLSTLDRVRA